MHLRSYYSCKLISESAMAALERFVVLLYDRTSGILNVNESRKYLFTQKGRSLENLSPTLEALKQHMEQAIYQSSKSYALKRGG